MNEEQRIQFFIRESIKVAESKPIPEAIYYLGGLLAIAGDQKEVEEVRRAFSCLMSCAEKLEKLSKDQKRKEMPLNENQGN